MNVNTFAAAATFATVLAISVAPPTARAEDPTTTGVYLYADEDGDTGTWTIRTTCTPDCVAHVTTSSGRGFDAALVDGRYTNTRTIPGGVTCPGHTAGDFGRWIPASEHPVTVTQWWDPATLAGEVDFFNDAAPCGLADRRDSFTLTRIDR
ncbi:hypothetical protein A5656_18530 [Mycobacterium gordonae]|nr:hypothetical protein [Mycobacterium gordonae]OBJ80970.1 hypothetical protein A9W97_26460 [Mycobacterium gordonae]OBK56769.1 hypothetical protein A5656_18530 [Mycobacterium gordonae]